MPWIINQVLIITTENIFNQTSTLNKNITLIKPLCKQHLFCSETTWWKRAITTYDLKKKIHEMEILCVKTLSHSFISCIAAIPIFLALLRLRSTSSIYKQNKESKRKSQLKNNDCCSRKQLTHSVLLPWMEGASLDSGSILNISNFSCFFFWSSLSISILFLFLSFPAKKIVLSC